MRIQQGQQGDTAGAIKTAAGAVPVVGGALSKGVEDTQNQNWPGLTGDVTGSAISLALPKIIGKTGEAVGEGVQNVKDYAATERGKAVLTGGAQLTASPAVYALGHPFIASGLMIKGLKNVVSGGKGPVVPPPLPPPDAVPPPGSLEAAIANEQATRITGPYVDYSSIPGIGPYPRELMQPAEVPMSTEDIARNAFNQTRRSLQDFDSKVGPGVVQPTVNTPVSYGSPLSNEEIPQMADEASRQTYNNAQQALRAFANKEGPGIGNQPVRPPLQGAGASEPPSAQASAAKLFAQATGKPIDAQVKLSNDDIKMLEMMTASGRKFIAPHAVNVPPPGAVSEPATPVQPVNTAPASQITDAELLALPRTPMLNKGGRASEAISSATYHPESQSLVVEHPNGSVGVHRGLPQERWEQLKNAPSKGKDYQSIIHSGKIRFDRLQEPTPKPTSPMANQLTDSLDAVNLRQRAETRYPALKTLKPNEQELVIRQLAAESKTPEPIIQNVLKGLK